MSSTQTIKEVPKLTKEELNVIERAHTVEKRFLSEQELRKPIMAIRNTIKNEELRLRNQHSWLQHQSFLGMAIFLASLGAMAVSGFYYMTGALSAWLTVVVFALAGSFLHELEHDLIHNLYFKSQRWVQDIMFFAIWIVKMSIPPWYRKMIHLRHHVVSGQKEDIEERMIGLGMNMGFTRLALTLDPFYVTLVMDDIKRDNPKDFNKFWIVVYALPTVIPFTIMVQLFIHYVRLVNGWTFTEYDPALYLPMALWPVIRDLAVFLVLPNILRQASLVLMSTYCHYYGDIPQNNAFYQNQILDHWILLPFQAFCFNFGATHIIHHYIPNQPFYLRQMLAPKVLETMMAVGVRNNDWGIVGRNNTYFSVDHPNIKAKEQ